MRPIVAVILLAVLSACTSSYSSSTTTTAGAAADSGPYTAFLDYRNAISSKNLAQFRESVSAGKMMQLEEVFGAPITEENFDDVSMILGISVPAEGNVIIRQQSVQEASATMSASDSTNPKLAGTITLVKEDGEWKLQDEVWVENP